MTRRGGMQQHTLATTSAMLLLLLRGDCEQKADAIGMVEEGDRASLYE
jgi:hypothetical protein